MGKISRNAPCPCGSRKKYKHCCGNPLKEELSGKATPLPAHIQAMLKEKQAKERIEIQQQGLGRRIISAEHKGFRFVAVKDTLHSSKKWKFFTDFLADYIRKMLHEKWGNAELKKPLEERHLVMQWYDAYCHFQGSHKKQPDGTFRGNITGIVHCYLGLAYNLYLIQHNVELQERLVERLKNGEQFQSAYHELMIANCLIRAGFELELEDETDRSSMHCEFSARSIRTGKKYSVEAKMRGVRGILGRTDADGADPLSDPTANLIKHINAALAKPGDGERLIFVDVNTEPLAPADFASNEPIAPKWMETSERKLERLERRLEDGVHAYVFVTNMAFHLALGDEFLGHAAIRYGLGIADYAKPLKYSLKDAWKIKQKHIDMEYIVETLTTYPRIPNHFDSDFPPTEPNRIKIGMRYEFVDAGVLGIVTAAHVSVDQKRIYLTVQAEDGTASILSETMSDYELEVYRQFPETYFGVVQEVPRNTKDPLEFFERLVEIHRTYPRESLLKMAKGAPDINDLEKLDDLELVLEFCERLSNNIMNRQARNIKNDSREKNKDTGP